MTVWESWQVIAFVGGIALLSALGIAKVLDAVEDWRQARQVPMDPLRERQLRALVRQEQNR